MAFVVDSQEWCFDNWSVEQISTALDGLLQRVKAARERNEKVWIGDDLQQRKVLGELSIWEWYISKGEVNLPPEIWQELSTWLNFAEYYLDEDVWPDGMTDTSIQIEQDIPQHNVDLAWAHHNVRTGTSVGCLSFQRSGRHKTISSQGNAELTWIRSESAHRTFWRKMIDYAENEAALESLAPHAFPDLYFHAGVWHGVRRLGGGYLAMRSEIKRYLSILDEYGHWAFTFPPPSLNPQDKTKYEGEVSPSNQILERRFRGFNIVMAPEKPNVYADTNCREAREITIKGKKFYCEWHGKLEPHRNRLHIHKPVPESNEKVIIAIIDEHLRLP